MNFAALTYHRQHELHRSKEWPLSKPKWLKILTKRYLFVSERWAAHFPRRFSLLRATSRVLKVCTCTLILCKKGFRPKPDQPDRLLRLCKERSLKLLQSIFQCSCIKMQPPTTWHQHALHTHAALPTSLPSTALHTHKQQMQRKEVVWYNIGSVSKQAIVSSSDGLCSLKTRPMTRWKVVRPRLDQPDRWCHLCNCRNSLSSKFAISEPQDCARAYKNYILTSTCECYYWKSNTFQKWSIGLWSVN